MFLLLDPLYSTSNKWGIWDLLASYVIAVSNPKPQGGPCHACLQPTEMQKSLGVQYLLPTTYSQYYETNSTVCVNLRFYRGPLEPEHEDSLSSLANGFRLE